MQQDVRQWLNARQTILEMMEQRGYTVQKRNTDNQLSKKDQDKKNVLQEMKDMVQEHKKYIDNVDLDDIPKSSREEILNQIKGIITNTTESIIAIKPPVVELDPGGKPKRVSKKVIAYFVTPKFNAEHVGIYRQNMHDINIFHSIIVYVDGTIPAKKNMEMAKDMHVEMFSLYDLQVNITKHRYQPIFEKLSKVEAQKFLKLYGAKAAILKVTDPVSRFYGYGIGDVIKITEKESGLVRWRIVKGAPKPN